MALEDYDVAEFTEASATKLYSEAILTRAGVFLALDAMDLMDATSEGDGDDG